MNANEPAYSERLRLAEKQELARQALCRGESTPETLAYARYLNAVENDATYSNGRFGQFKSSDEQVLRQWPFLADALLAALEMK